MRKRYKEFFAFIENGAILVKHINVEKEKV